MPTPDSHENDIVRFLRRRDYVLVRELGQGACGKTVLLRDDAIDEYFVCKKYTPYDESERPVLFQNFLREIKLLHRLYHDNVVRIFSCHVYPDKYTGYILMEHVDGQEIDDYARHAPDQVAELFVQAVAGFAYLERCGILHRDIRPTNLMVRQDGRLKIIDLGFGKEITSSKDFEKSISLNLWCAAPREFDHSLYDFTTEVYFVGKLFEQLIEQTGSEEFEHRELLREMCQRDPERRTSGFDAVEQQIHASQFQGIGFDFAELQTYRAFSDSIKRQIVSLLSGAKYVVDTTQVERQLQDACRRFMLEETVPDAAIVINCFVHGGYRYKRKGLNVSVVRDFLRLFKSATEERRKIILANLQTKLDAVDRHDPEPFDESSIPF